VALLVLGAISCAPGSDRQPFLVLAGPKDVVRLEVADEEGNLLWVLEAEPPRTLDAIWYGEVPGDFKQVVPADNWLPRPLEPGELVTAETTTSKRLFTHIGVAKSSTTMEIINYSMEQWSTGETGGVTPKR